jgi:hypothetical protein
MNSQPERGAGAAPPRATSPKLHFPVSPAHTTMRPGARRNPGEDIGPQQRELLWI